MPSTQPPNYYQVLIIGGGQAGLSMSYLLKQQGISHLILERNRLGHAWRSERWDSFCLVTPNWQCKLPGFPYQGTDPDGFMTRTQIVEYLDAYIASFTPPAWEGVAVTNVQRAAEGGFRVATSAGVLHAGQVVVAAGGYHAPIVPQDAARMPAGVAQLHSSDYMNPEALPPGEVLVVGTGQSGCQIAEDLHLAGRRVHLCVGSAPRVARRYRGKDVVKWLDQMDHYNLPVDLHPLGAGVRDKTNHYVTGREGGRDIDLRKFALQGMQLYGRYESLADGVVNFGGDLRQNLDGADAAYLKINDSIDKYIATHGIDAPQQARYSPPWQPPADAPNRLDLNSGKVSAVVWCIGFRTDFSWIDADIFDQRGSPLHQRGVTAVPGLYFLGLPWQYTWGSGRFSGVACDAAWLARHIVDAAHENEEHAALAASS